ncbi:FCD domain-containing protein [Rhodobacterales bacterium LSUCC0387]|nr:FCD domain-containing protein [Rhodobacterales bacterium LSUCC0387]
MSEFSSQNLADQMAQKLRRSILRGDVRPGEPIKERDTATAMGVSRTPMREAIRILSKEGLVELRPSRSPVVAQLDIKSATEQAAVLIALENLSVELACENATKKDLENMQQIVEYMDMNFYEFDPLDMFEVDMSFHTAIAEASHNSALAKTHQAFQQRLWHARYLAARQRRNRDRVVSQHNSILKGLKMRDKRVAGSAVEAHLSQLAEDIRQQITSQNAQEGYITRSNQRVGE